MNNENIKVDEELIKACVNILAKAYCPYSNFPVGCAVRDENGAIHVGVNVENAAYPVGNCAEASAIAAMIAAGGKKLTAIAVSSKSSGLATPCGACRQRLREFASDLNLPIFICSPEGVQATFTLETLLPNSFGPDDLN